MRRWVSAVIASVAACSGRGVEIEIMAEDGAAFDRVELHVAYEQCYDSDAMTCANGVAWPNQSSRPDGNIYFLKDEERIVAELQQGRAVLHLTAALGFADPVSIAVIGYSGDRVSAVKVLRDVHIPTSGVAIWQVYLHPATLASADVTTPAPVDPSYRVLVWPRQPTAAVSDPTGCVVYQRWDGVNGWQTEYFVPSSDPDCDGLQPECSEYWYAYNVSGAGNACVTTSGTVLPNVCRVGISACADGIRDSADCAQEPNSAGLRCLPDAACERCSASVPVELCLAQGFTNSGTGSVPFSECKFYPDVSSAEHMPCPGATTIAHPLRGASCTDVLLHTAATPLTGGSRQITIGQNTTFEAHLDTLSDSCGVAIVWKTGSAIDFANGITVAAELLLANGNSVFYPISIKSGGDTQCVASTPPTECTALGSTTDHLFDCAR